MNDGSNSARPETIPAARRLHYNSARSTLLARARIAMPHLKELPDVKRVYLIGIGGTAMASLAGMLQQRGYEVAGSDEHVYPPMSTYLEQPADPGARRVYERASRDVSPRSGRDRQRRREHERRSGRDARARPAVHLDAGGDLRALHQGEALDRRHRHARQDDHDLADGVAARGRRPRSEHGRRRHPAELQSRTSSSATGRTSSSKATSTTPRSSTRARSSCTTARTRCS